VKRKEQNLKSWFKSGSPWVWMTASGVSIAVIMTIGLLAVIALAFKSTGWFSAVPFAITLLVTHLGLLAAETKRVSMTLAHPGLAPSARKVGDEPTTDPTSPQE
jgi:ABC-type phosphate transport system auxiliary subunit